MNLKAVSKKIKLTRLFSDAQKVEILAMLPEATDEDIVKLESGIDTFDREYKAAVGKHTKEITALLATLFKDMPEEEKQKHQEAIDELSMGLALLQPASN